MGDQNCATVPISLPQPTRAGTTAKPSYIFKREKPLDTGGGMCPFGKGHYNQTTQSSTSREFFFLVTKKGGTVINLKRLNKWVEPQHFKMEGLGTLRELLRLNYLWDSLSMFPSQ